MRKLGYLTRVCWLMATKRIIGHDDVSADYDRLSSGYDEFFSHYMAPHSLEMLERLGLQQGMRTADLACGTGMIACASASKVGRSGCVHGFDRSSGMLGAAERRSRMMGLNNLSLTKGDMLDGIARKAA